MTQKNSVELFKNKIHAVNLENWYDQLKDYTFETTFLDLSPAEAHALIRAFNHHKGKNPNNFTDDDDRLLKHLASRIDAVIVPYQNSSGAFVRLSTRSPKDAVIAQTKTQEFWKQELEAVGDPEIAAKDENARLIALIKASTNALKVHSGEEAVNLIKVSERSNEDLLLALEFPDSWDMKIIIRKWVSIPPSMEFRGFVHEKKLTALSQYFHIVYFPDLPPQKELIQSRIFHLFEQIKDIIPVNNFIIDFGVVEDKVLVIELNPFHDYEGCGTDPGLFDWKIDRKIVDGEAPFEFRVREEPFDVKPHIILEWRQMIASEK
jgi:hypothetical protein